MIILGSIVLVTAYLARITLLYAAGFCLLATGWVLLVTKWTGARSATRTTSTPLSGAAYQRLVPIKPNSFSSSTNRKTTEGDHDADVIRGRRSKNNASTATTIEEVEQTVTGTQPTSGLGH